MKAQQLWRWLAAALAAVLVTLICVVIYVVTVGTTVYRTPYGFFPSEISVPVGTPVTFKNVSGSIMWPASDVHPNHSILAGFDARTIIESGQQWQYVFEQPGQWRFHDHTAAQFTGMVLVHDAGGNTMFDCGEGEPQRCWMSEIEDALYTEGVPEAFEALRRIHASNPKFATWCHNFTHDIGLKAYVEYGKDVAYGPETSFCNSGFYHGFMEGFIDDELQIEAAYDYCQGVGHRFSTVYPLARSQCIHGIGHGLFDYYVSEHPELLAEPTQLFTKVFQQCERLEMIDYAMDDQIRCPSGAFNVYKDILDINTSLADMVKSDSRLLEMCSVFTEEHQKRACYSQLVPAFIPHDLVKDMLDGMLVSSSSIKAYTLDKLIPYTEHDQYLGWATIAWGTQVGRLSVNGYAPELLIKSCEQVPGEVRRECIRGIFAGAFGVSEPQREYRNLNRLCLSSELTSIEKASCYNSFQRLLALTYAETGRAQCSYIPIRYHSVALCLQEPAE